MTPRRFRALLILVLLPVLATVSTAADDAYGDPIPEGARLRLGTARMRTVYSSPNILSPDGKFLIGSVPGGNGYIDFTGKVVRSVMIKGEFGTVMGISADGKRALSSSFQAAFVWDTETGEVIAKSTRSTPSGDNGVSLSADGKIFAAGGIQGFGEKEKDKPPVAIVWDVDGNKQLSEIKAAQNQTIYVAVSPDGKRVATWGYYYDRTAKEPPKPEADPNKMIQFWNTADGKELSKARILTGFQPTAVAFSPDSSLAAASSGDGSIYLFDPVTGEQKGLLLGRSRQGRRIVFSPDGKTIAAGGDDGSVQRWRVADGTRLGITESPVPLTFSPRGLLFTDNERVLIWAVRGMTALIWDSTTGKLLSPAGGHYNNITGAAVAAGGKEIVTASGDGTLVRWDAATGMQLGSQGLKLPAGGFSGTGMVVGPIALSVDGTKALASEGSGGIAVYDLPAGTQQFVIPGDINRDNRGVLTNDGTRVIQFMTSYDVKKHPARIAVWDVIAAKKLGQVELPGWTQPAASLSPDGKTLVVAGLKPSDKGDGSGEFLVVGYELATGRKLGEYAEVGGFGLVAVATLGDNKSAVVTTPKSGPIVVDYTTGMKLRDIELNGGRVGVAPVVGPDGKSTAIPLTQNYGPMPTSPVLIVDAETGKVKQRVDGVSGTASTIVFAPDGRSLITGSYDSTVLVWSISEK
jgi:WD40 repeat protein